MTAAHHSEAAARYIVDELRRANHEALWAGGCVRDMLLGRSPSDIDVATSATPEQVIALFRNTRKVGVQFGVVLVRAHHQWIEVATFRREANYQDGRRPEQVVFTDAREDAQRRDFTINGLFFDPQSGQVVDFVGGQADLAAGIIRAIGDSAERFAEDHLRLLRAVRFAARLEFAIEPTTAAAIREHASKLSRISPERIREELQKMLIHPNRARALELMDSLGLLPHLWPDAIWTTEQIHTARQILSELPAETGFILVMVAMLHHRTASEVERILKALRCSNQEIELATWLAEHEANLAGFHTLSLAAARKLRAHPGFESLQTLAKAVCIVARRPLSGVEAAHRLAVEIPQSQATPPPLVTGEDLIELGIRPGPVFKQILDQLYEAQLNRDFVDREAALARLEEIAAKSGARR